MMEANAALIRGVNEGEARVNVTWAGQNADLPDPVAVDATDAQVKQWVTEAVQVGFVGMPADARANFADYVVDRYPANEARPFPSIQVRPKTPFGV